MSGLGTLAVDIGKTGARCGVWPEAGAGPSGPPAATATAAGMVGLAAPGGVAEATRLVVELIGSLPVGARPDERGEGWRLGVGVPGALATPERAQQLADRLARSRPGLRVAVTSDAVTAHCGALGAALGIVAALGTGVSVLALASDSTYTLIDGAGPYLGDRGGGAQIGRLALGAVLRARDGAGPETALTAAAMRRFGPAGELAATFAAASNPARLAASFAPDVADCAAAGDAAARDVLLGAAAEIASSIRAAQAWLARGSSAGDRPVAATGGLLHLGEQLLGPLRANLGALTLRPAIQDPLAGAARLAAADDTAWERAVHRSTPAGAAGPRPTTELGRLATEQARPGAEQLDGRPTIDLVAAMLTHEAEALEALRTLGPALAGTIDTVAERMRRGGRLIYVGAGTPGRLAYLDAAECEPTFGVPPGVVVALIAGGEGAVRRAVEGAEDDADLGARDVGEVAVSALDSVVGISASGRTPYVVGALRAARAAGAFTVGVANNVDSELADVADQVIEIDSGAEVIAGSTRLAAGTTQKVTLNTVSTGVMVALGKTYRGRMVDVRATNVKLRDRVIRIVRDLAEVDEPTATSAVTAADGEAKTAVVSLLTGTTAAQARAALAAAGGRVADVVDGPRP